MKKVVIYIDAEVKPVTYVNKSSFSTMIQTILKEDSLLDELFVIKGKKVFSGKHYKNICYGVMDNKAQNMVAQAQRDGYMLHGIYPNIQRNNLITEYYDDEYGVYVGPTKREETRLKLVLVYEKDVDDPTVVKPHCDYTMSDTETEKPGKDKGFRNRSKFNLPW